MDAWSRGWRGTNCGAHFRSFHECFSSVDGVTEGESPLVRPAIAWAEVTIDYSDTERAAAFGAPSLGFPPTNSGSMVGINCRRLSVARFLICSQYKRRRPGRLELNWTFGSMTSRAQSHS